MFLSSPVTFFVTSTASFCSSVGVVTSFDGVSFAVALLITFPALISSSVTTCVNFTDFVSPGSIVGIVASFSTALLSFTSTFSNFILPIFFTSISYSIFSPMSYFPLLSWSLLVTFLITCNPSVLTTSGSVGFSESPIKATFLITPLTLLILTSNVTVASELAFT